MTNTITFSKFFLSNGDRRIYINGTTREKIWFEPKDGKITGNAASLKPQPNTSSLFARREKDKLALKEARTVAAEFLGVERMEITFEALWNVAK